MINRLIANNSFRKLKRSYKGTQQWLANKWQANIALNKVEVAKFSFEGLKLGLNLAATALTGYDNLRNKQLTNCNTAPTNAAMSNLLSGANYLTINSLNSTSNNMSSTATPTLNSSLPSANSTWLSPALLISAQLLTAAVVSYDNWQKSKELAKLRKLAAKSDPEQNQYLAKFKQLAEGVVSAGSTVVVLISSSLALFLPAACKDGLGLAFRYICGITTAVTAVVPFIDNIVKKIQLNKLQSATNEYVTPQNKHYSAPLCSKQPVLPTKQQFIEWFSHHHQINANDNQKQQAKKQNFNDLPLVRQFIKRLTKVVGLKLVSTEQQQQLATAILNQADIKKFNDYLKESDETLRAEGMLVTNYQQLSANIKKSLIGTQPNEQASFAEIHQYLVQQTGNAQKSQDISKLTNDYNQLKNTKDENEKLLTQLVKANSVSLLKELTDDSSNNLINDDFGLIDLSPATIKLQQSLLQLTEVMLAKKITIYQATGDKSVEQPRCWLINKQQSVAHSQLSFAANPKLRIVNQAGNYSLLTKKATKPAALDEVINQISQNSR